MAKSEKADWEAFEEAVEQFLRALAPGPRIVHDVKLPDADTGLPRQRDVWIETALGGHIPMKILVSCKREKRKLHQQDIDHFWGEFQSSGAHKGVIYSHSGFTQPAIEKATVKGISCCRLYQKEPADLPESLAFTAYLTAPQAGLSVSVSDAIPHSATWSHVFALPGPGTHATVLDAIVERYREFEQDGVRELERDSKLPKSKGSRLQVMDGETVVLTVDLVFRWRRFRAKYEACLLDGSYEMIEGNFKGVQFAPVLSLKDPYPGPGWEEVHADEEVTSPALLIISHRQNLRAGLIDFASQPVVRATDPNVEASQQ